MAESLILRPSGLLKRPWALQIRESHCGGTEYATLTNVDDITAKTIIRCGAPYWLYGEPDWEAHYARQRKLRLEQEIKERQEELAKL